MKKHASPFTLRRSQDLLLILEQARKLSPDPIVRKKGYGWFPRLVLAALRQYVESLSPAVAEEVKQ